MFQAEHPAETYNLPLVLAYGVLDSVMKALVADGVFLCPERKHLKDRMDASKPHLPWADFETVDRGRDERNAVAHEAKLLSMADCLRYIDAIRRELVGWSIIEGTRQEQGPLATRQ